MEDIEDLLFYSCGDIQLILCDLHSVLDVPDITKGRSLRAFHVSLWDFLMDPNCSGMLFLNEGLAWTQLTQCFMQRICKFLTSSPQSEYTYSSLIIITCVIHSLT